MYALEAALYYFLLTLSETLPLELHLSSNIGLLLRTCPP
jgi:hypothetical protein